MCRSAAWIAALVCCLPLEAGADGGRASASARYYEGLRQRRLFGLAAGELLDRLERGRLSERQRLDFTLELSRTFLEHARFAAGEEQDELWRQAAAVVDRLLADDPRNARRVLLEFQRALVPAARGEVLAGRSELSPDDQPLAAQAREALGEAVRLLESLAESVEVELRKATASRRSTGEGLTPYELRTLLSQTRFHLGGARLEQARTLPPLSSDRAAALIEAETWLKQVAGGPPGEPLTWNAQLLLARSSRLRGDLKTAERLLVQIENDQPPSDALDRVLAERVRMLLDAGDAPEAAAVLADHRRQHTAVAGELQFLNVEALAAVWDIATARNDRDLAGRLLASLESFAAQAVREVGGYWGYRAQLVLEDVRERARHGPALAGAIRKARTLYANRRFDEALAAYAAAQAAARDSGQPPAAFELGYTRASIALEIGRYAEAARDLLALIEEFPNAAQAAEAHLLAAWCLGRVYEQSPTAPNRIAYTEALGEHRQRYAGSPTVHDAAWMLGLLEERRLQATVALKLYRTVPADHRRGPQAQVAVARCHEVILARLRDVLRNTPEADRRRDIRALLDRTGYEAVAELTGFVGAYPEPPGRLTLEQAEVCLRLARILLGRPLPEYARADGLLERIFQSGEITPTSALDDDADSDGGDSTAWKPLLQTAAQLRIVSLAGQGEFRRAEELVRSLSGSRAADVLGILDGLGELTRDAGENTRFHVGRLQLRAAAELDSRRGELSPAEQQQLDLCLAEAYVAGGQSREGIQRYERVLATQPGNDAVRRRLAEVLVEACGTRECLDKARGHWRRLESAANAGTPAWLEARYHVTRCAVLLDDYEEARKLLTITRLLYPDLGGESLRPRFESLEDELSRRR